MKTRKLFLAAFIFMGIFAVAQDTADSIDTNVELQEVVIEAPKVIRKADMDVLYPSASQQTCQIRLVSRPCSSTAGR